MNELPSFKTNQNILWGFLGGRETLFFRISPSFTTNIFYRVAIWISLLFLKLVKILWNNSLSDNIVCIMHQLIVLGFLNKWAKAVIKMYWVNRKGVEDRKSKYFLNSEFFLKQEVLDELRSIFLFKLCLKTHYHVI